MEDARRIAERAWESYRVRFERFGPSLEWVEDYVARIGFYAGSIALKGQIVIRPRRLDVSLDVPVVLNVFKRKAVAAIEREIRKWEKTGEEGS